jgi:26S proteasome regulatory subunit N1
MTSVPKPLKFLRGHYAGLKDYYRSLKKKSEIKGMLADIISFLAMTASERDSLETLKFRLASGNHDIAMWGHEYIRHLCSEIGDEYMRRISEDVIEDLTDLMDLVEKIVPWNMAHNAEPEAVDLCLEVDRLDLVEKHVDLTNCDRTCLYLLSCCSYLPEPDDQNAMLCAYRCFMSLRLYTNALRVSLRIGDVDLMAQAMANSDDNVEKKQIAYILGDCRIWIDFLDEEVADDPSVLEELQAIMGCVFADMNSSTQEGNKHENTTD